MAGIVNKGGYRKLGACRYNCAEGMQKCKNMCLPTLVNRVDFQWSLKAPEKDNESREGDVPRLQLRFPDQGSEPVKDKWPFNACLK